MTEVVYFLIQNTRTPCWNIILESCDFFCLQLDDSSDAAGITVLLAFVRYLHDIVVNTAHSYNWQ
jgi:hypothetical protein